MIAAVSPTSASSRNGTPAPRSDSASRPPEDRSAGEVSIARSLTTRATVLDEGESVRLAHGGVHPRTALPAVAHHPRGPSAGSVDERLGLHAENFRDGLGSDRTLPQHPWVGTGEIDDR